MRAKKQPDLQEIAASRIVELAHEIGAEMEFARGWIAEASRKTGIPYATLWSLCSGTNTRTSLKTIQHICRKTGCEIRDVLGD